jgi:hypothetical protein
MSQAWASLGCPGSARLFLGQAQARARVEPGLAAQARLDKILIELSLTRS